MLLISSAKKIEKGNFNTKVDIQTGDELEELAKTFNKTIETLEKTDAMRKQIDHAKTEFLSITSHELRSPMTPMRAQLQMLEKNYFGKLNKKQTEAVDIVLRNTERLDRIIMDFLEISRIEAARLKFNFIRTSLNKPLERLVEEMGGFMQEKHIKLELKAEKLPIFEVDPDRVMQVLRNLVNNAKKFSPNKSKIIIEAKEQNKGVLISVKDEGVGISEENQIRIFEPFFQAEQTMYNKKGGTGLGLAICKGIVESQNGKIWIESKEGKGTTFYFTVPSTPVKEMKSIKVLFSQNAENEAKIKELFIDMLGPLGDLEFDLLKKNNKFSKEELNKYIDYLGKKQIIFSERVEEFKIRLNILIGV